MKITRIFSEKYFSWKIPWKFRGKFYQEFRFAWNSLPNRNWTLVACGIAFTDQKNTYCKAICLFWRPPPWLCLYTHRHKGGRFFALAAIRIYLVRNSDPASDLLPIPIHIGDPAFARNLPSNFLGIFSEKYFSENFLGIFPENSIRNGKFSENSIRNGNFRENSMKILGKFFEKYFSGKILGKFYQKRNFPGKFLENSGKILSEKENSWKFLGKFSENSIRNGKFWENSEKIRWNFLSEEIYSVELAYG